MNQEALDPPRSGLILELDFRRLLQRCEEIANGDSKGRQDLQEWPSSPAFHANIDLLQEQVADLSGVLDNRIDGRLVEIYQRRVRSLVRQLRPVALPNYVKAAKRESERPSIRANTSVKTAPTSSKPSEIRQRSNVGFKGPLQQETKERLNRQSNLQDDLTDEMVTLAASLKRNALAMQTAVHRRGDLLDETENAVEDSLVQAKQSSKQSQKLKIRGSISICTFLLLMAVTCMILMGTYFFIKTTSFLGYKRRP